MYDNEGGMWRLIAWKSIYTSSGATSRYIFETAVGDQLILLTSWVTAWDTQYLPPSKGAVLMQMSSRTKPGQHRSGARRGVEQKRWQLPNHSYPKPLRLVDY